MKKLLAITLALVMVLTFCACGANRNADVAVLWSGENDKALVPNSLINAVDRAMYIENISYAHHAAAGDAEKQLQQLEEALQAGCTGLLVELVDPAAAQQVADLAKEKGVPVVFFNCTVDSAVTASYDKSAVVTTDEATLNAIYGKMIGQSIADNFEAAAKNPGKTVAFDRNGDGVISYCPVGDVSALADAVDAVLTEAGLSKLEAVEGPDMDSVLADHNDGNGNMIELVITASDEAALNVLAKLQSIGYFRGTGWYAKSFDKMDLPQTDRYYLELCGANSSADVYLNGRHLAHHDGGYSTWRVDITDALQRENLLAIAVDNSPNETVYPQVADFTFYGGLYRNVNLIAVSESHFDLDHFGGPGIKVTPVMDGSNANVEVEVFLTNAKMGQSIRYTLTDREGNVVAQSQGNASSARFVIENAHRWHGRKDPYLYTAKAELLEGETVLDDVSARFGCRSFSIDPDRGFILNGEEYPLRGVSRHQDRWGFGNALLPEHHEEDMDLICEVGATTIRLAHYQHDQYFYDLCDERGMVIWAEIPYISKHMPTGRENTLQQMKELVIQNYNHPSIVVWGLSNEITISGSSDDLLENHKLLNDICHDLDKTRLTTIACVSPCDIHDAYIKIPDVVSYNHYFGWYGGDTSMNGPWFDKFHAAHPNIPIGCSEYGCEALNWHTSQPRQGDYTEEYQSFYHEELIRQFFTRKYLWATHVWNMFDFGADARSEGGENGQNHKGLVTFDRKYKKDSFYAYKAWLSDEPFVHLCSKRYIDRVEDVTRITVYSNQKTVELFANGISLGVKEADDHFFYFDVPNVGETRLVAVSGDLRDESIIRKVDTFNESYRLREKNAILNWFDITEPEGYFSLNDKIGDIMRTLKGKMLFLGLMGKFMPKKVEKVMGGFEMTGPMMDMMGGFTVLRLSGMIGTMGINLTKEDLLNLNAQLNKIKKPK